MIPPRVKRLIRDSERLQARFASWPLIRISAANGSPPEQYQFTYSVKSLYVSAGGEILERENHVLEVNLSLGYPRRAPQCKMLTPVFHPNFDNNTVCIGDFWAASEGLEDLVIRIGRMLSYQEYNVKSPLNGLAAKWAAENTSLLPVDTREIAPPLPSGETVEEGNSIVLGEGNGSGAACLKHAANSNETITHDRWDEKIVINLDSPNRRTAAQPQLPNAQEQKVVAGTLIRFSPGLRMEEMKVSCRGCGQSMLLDASLLDQPFDCPNCKRIHRVAWEA